MAKLKVVIQKPAAGTYTYGAADGAYAIEREALDPIDAEIVEVDAKTEEEFIAAARDARRADRAQSPHHRRDHPRSQELQGHRSRERGRGHRRRGRRHRGGDRGDQRPRRLHRRGRRPHDGDVLGRAPSPAPDAPAHGGGSLARGPAVVRRDPAPLRPDDGPHLVRERGEGGRPPLPRLRPARGRLRSVRLGARHDVGRRRADHQSPGAPQALRLRLDARPAKMPRRTT